MKAFLTLVTFAAATTALSVSNPHHIDQDGQHVMQDPERFLIETEPGKTQWVTEDQKWELKREGVNFMDISAERHTWPHVVTPQNVVAYPAKPAYNATVKKLAKSLEKQNMRTHLETFTAFHTRYYKSDYGVESAKWLMGQVNDTLAEAGALDHGASVDMFPHPWGQFSIIARLPGKSNKTVVVGAHQDSINLFLPSFLAAPGADDDGSGTVTILEALRVLLRDRDIVAGKASNTVEFHWYSAEEGGLLGSQAIFSHYHQVGRDVRAMLQQDMTGYVHNTLAAGEPESVGVITDFVDTALTEFIKSTVEEYCDIPYVLTKCGYACSDHASASKYGYPSAFVIESDFKYSDKKIHTTDDKLEYLSFDHMLQHAKMTLGYAYELAMANL